MPRRWDTGELRLDEGEIGAAAGAAEALEACEQRVSAVASRIAGQVVVQRLPLDAGLDWTTCD
jgi:hypothetical protein